MGYVHKQHFKQSVILISDIWQYIWAEVLSSMSKTEALRVFKAFSGKVHHASLDGERTLCGKWIDSIWIELQPEVWQNSWKECPRCKAHADKIDLRGEQAKLD